MDGSNFIKAEIARRAWKDGFADGLSGMLAIAFALRNRFDAGWWNGDWASILGHYRDLYYKIEPDPEPDVVPDPRVYSFQSLLQEMDGIFDGTRKDDITVPAVSVLAHPASPVLYWARLNEITNEDFLEQISRRPDIHPRLAQVGSLTLFA